MTVEFGLALENFTPETKVPDMDAVCAYSITAEELGFASVWAWDHLFLGARRPFPFLEALTTLSMVAARTSRIMLGTGILVLPDPGASHPGQDRGDHPAGQQRPPDARRRGRLVRARVRRHRGSVRAREARSSSATWT